MIQHNQRAAAGGWAAAQTAVMTLGLGAGSPAAAGDPNPLSLNPAQLAAGVDVPTNLMLAQASEPTEPVAERTEIETVQDTEEPALPISLGLSYALYTDYIFRGVNFSEYDGEAREKLNHQLTVSLAWDMGDYGTIGFDTWFEWFAGQKKIDPDRGGQNLQEVDYTIWWSYSIEPIATDLTLGYTFFQFPNLAHTLRQDGARGNNNDDRTHEYWFSLEHNDAWMWKPLFPDNEEGILNPSFFFAHDVGAIPGAWMEFGLSHGFAVPGVDNLTITPAWTLCVDGDYWTRGFKLAGDQWSLAAEYDLTPVLQLPDWAGSISITGELYFFNAFGNMEDSHTIQDEFWGGLTVNWAWGG